MRFRIFSEKYSMNDEYRERLIHEIMGCLQELYPDFMYNMTVQDTLDWLDKSVKTLEVKNELNTKRNK